MRQAQAKPVEGSELVAVARDEATATGIDEGKRTEPVVLQLEESIGIVERFGTAAEKHGLELHRKPV